MLRTRIGMLCIVGVFAVTGCKKKDDQKKPTKKPATTKPAPEKKPETKPEAKPDKPAPKPEAKNENLHTEEVSYTAGATTLKGYLAYDKTIKGPRPGILIVHEWWGHNEYVRRRARMLAELGYTALALDMYGDGKNTEHPADAKKFMETVLGNFEEGIKRFKAAHSLLTKHATTDAKKTSAIGYCFGGAVVLNMARLGLPLDGVASFHGSLQSKKPAQKGKVKAKLLVMNGAADPFVPAKSIEAFKKEMKDAGAQFEFINYPNAKHAFTNPAATAKGKKFKLPLAYDKDADTRSWDKLKGFLAGLYPPAKK